MKDQEQLPSNFFGVTLWYKPIVLLVSFPPNKPVWANVNIAIAYDYSLLLFVCTAVVEIFEGINFPKFYEFRLI